MITTTQNYTEILNAAEEKQRTMTPTDAPINIKLDEKGNKLVLSYDSIQILAKDDSVVFTR